MSLARVVQSTCRKSPINLSLTSTTTNMPTAVRNTVDRLDKPSAYYQSRVGCPSLSFPPALCTRADVDYSPLEQET